jgi:hypothetical protein
MMKRFSYGWVLAVAACAGGASEPEHADTTGGAEAEPAETAAPAEPKVETERDKLLRFAKEKREQCSTLADVLQKNEMREDDIVKLREADRIEALAKEHETTASSVAGVKITVDELGALRDKYVGTHRDMAAALGEASAAPKDADKRKAMDRYRKLDEGKKVVIEEINAWCAKPIEEPSP